MKISRFLFACVAAAGTLVMSLPAQATDAREISDELFAELEVADVEPLNEAAFGEFDLAQAAMAKAMDQVRLAQIEIEEIEVADSEDEALHRDRAAYNEDMALARKELEHAAREMARLTKEKVGDMAIRIHERQPKAMLGVELGGGQEMKRKEGVQVVGVAADSPAEKAGLRGGDILVKIDDMPLKADDHDSAVDKLTGYMADVEPGQKLTVEYLRDGKSHKADIEAAEFKIGDFDFNFDFDFSDGDDAHAFAFSMPDGGPGHGGPRFSKRMFAFSGPAFGGALGEMEMVSLTPELGEYFGARKGLLVVRSPQDGDIDIKDGDVILKIGDREPSSPGQAIRIIGSYEPGDKIELQVMRKKKKRKLEITVPKYDHDARIWKDSKTGTLHELKQHKATGT